MNEKRTNNKQVFLKALSKTRQLLIESETKTLNYDKIHSVKSVLYAAIEQVGLKAERLSSIQRMFRELFAIVTSSSDLKSYERKVGIQILNDLIKRYETELLEGRQVDIHEPYQSRMNQ